MNVVVTMADAQESMTDGAFQRAGSVLNKCKNIVREEFQSATSPQIKEIISKLSDQEPISDQDMDLIKLWIVGDAESYTKMENDFQGWLDEYERLRTALNDYENKECTAEDLLKRHGILQDATRVNYDIANFLEQKDRIQKFESAITGSLDKDGRAFLARILSDKLNSPDR